MEQVSALNSEEEVKRFSVYRIVEHAVLIVLFIVLACTGLPQKFYVVGVSQSIIILLGGIDNLRLIHHIAGGLFGALAVQHIAVNFAGIMFCRSQPSMLITFKDAHDAFQNVRYYLGLSDGPASSSWYSYKEKCIYWLVLIGGSQMIMTGLILWFPVISTKFLPGIFVPLSKTVHTSDAMLIFLLIITWHIYDSVLSPEVFPFNASIFTGYAKKRQLDARAAHAESREMGIDSHESLVDRKHTLL